MQTSNFWITVLLLFCSCDGQEKINLVISNKSTAPIDSIIVPYPLNKVYENIERNNSKELTIDVSSVNTSQEGTLIVNIYQKNKVYTATWGFHDYGSFAQSTEHIYLFDHGVNYKNKPLQKPLEFVLYFSNISSKRIDSIYSLNNSIRMINERTPRQLEIIYDYDKIQKQPVFLISLSGKKYIKRLSFHDFDNWNKTEDLLSFENDSLTKNPSVTFPMEFVVDLQVQMEVPLDSVQIESPAITKVYNDDKRKNKRIVFDYEKFVKNPMFKVYVGNLVFTEDLSNHDFTNKSDNQQIIFLTEKGLRTL